MRAVDKKPNCPPATVGNCGCRVASLRIERESDDEFVESDDRALTLAVFLEEDDV